ncbi:FAD-dependent oxidoreductase [Modestobacter sp. NPDC049651]|uniref:FAD-dependent oxidoreductase n=1 Tax=unclassified Modestobacter TaxID=2643866 RepID=UPI0033E28407
MRTTRQRLVVVGGDAAGMSAAAQARRLRSAGELEVVVLEQGPDVSYSACGIPYWVGGLVDGRDDLVVRTPAEFADRDITVHTGTRATGIDLAAGAVTTADGRRFGYDQLLVATGGRPVRPPVPGLDAPGVFGVHRLDDGAAVRAAVEAGARSAVVLGGGYIGLEMAEALQRQGLEVTVVFADPLPMQLLDDDMGERVCAAMGRMGFAVHPDQAVREVLVDAAGRARGVRTDAGEHAGDLVVLGLGMGPEVRLADDAGLALGPTGAIDVDHAQRCRDHPEVLAAGDCAQTTSRITGEPVHVPLGTHANAQGRVAGSVAAGHPARFPGVLGTALTRVGELEVARTGLCTSEAERAGFAFRADTIESTTRAGYLPGAAEIAVKVVSEQRTGRLLGAQVVGGPGAGKRIDVLATAIWAGLTADELAGADLSYAPPFGPTRDPVAVAARVAARG